MPHEYLFGAMIAALACAVVILLVLILVEHKRISAVSLETQDIRRAIDISDRAVPVGTTGPVEDWRSKILT